MTTHPRMPPEAKIALFTRLGHWYSEKVARPDLGVPCFQAVLSVDPANEGALEGLAQVYRRAQQWQELGQVLVTRADRAPTPGARARPPRRGGRAPRDPAQRVERAPAISTRQIFAEDPGHQKATRGARAHLHAGSRTGPARQDPRAPRRGAPRRGEGRGDLQARRALRGPAQRPARGDAPLRGGARRRPAEPHRPQGPRPHLQPHAATTRSCSTTSRSRSRSARRRGRRSSSTSAWPASRTRSSSNHEKAAEASRQILLVDGAHEGALTALARHYRALGRWEDVVQLYEKHLRIVTDDKRRVELYLALGRVLVDQIGSPERARKAYEKVLEIDPNHGGALESLAHVRAATGDALAALTAIESLAEKAPTPEGKAELWIRAAKMLEEKGDRDGAIERYKKALDAQPQQPRRGGALRAAYLARGDATSAVELIARELEVAEGNLAKARLYGEMAQLLREKLKDNDRAKEAATKAVDLDPTSMLGLLVSGDLAFEAGALPRGGEALRVAREPRRRAPEGPGRHASSMRYVDALAQERQRREGRSAR